ncbi:MAG TPA: type II toxin-antitoxin system death-on-curing family toxin [Thermomicrobiales bacterium]|nr:type II toxin-antitoxin system death-on-curing family toxin [Thermomicrobiales bacterium]
MATRLTLADMIALHADVMERAGVAARPLRDEGALDSALMRTRAAEYYEEADLVRQAALLAVGISQAQAFLDGNKRTAQIAMQVFLRLNQLAFTGDPLDLARQLEAVAERPGERAAAEADVESWLRKRVAPLNPA